MAQSRLAVCLFALALTCSPARAVENYRLLILQHKYAAAAALLKRTASKGKPLAQYRLAMMYRLGLGVRRDEAAAQHWLAAAAKLGNSDAAVMLRALSNVQETRPATDIESSRLKALPAFPLPSVAHVGAPSASLPDWTIAFTARKLPEQPGLTGGKKRLEVQTATGETALLIAARQGASSIAISLLQEGANVTVTDKRGWTAWTWAARNGDLALLADLEKSKPQNRDLEITKAAYTAIRYCQFDALDMLIKAGAVVDERADVELTGSLADGTCQQWGKLAARVLTLQGMRSDKFEEHIQRIKLAATQAPVGQDYGALHIAALNADAALVSQLLLAGAEANAITEDGTNALMLSASRGCSRCVEALVPVTADINLKNADEETALFLAVKSGSVATVKLLLAAGASPDSRNLSRDTPAKLAARMKNSEMTLLFGG